MRLFAFLLVVLASPGVHCASDTGDMPYCSATTGNPYDPSSEDDCCTDEETYFSCHGSCEGDQLEHHIPGTGQHES
jgi:hypothetical protein